jgi:hypothetical protein
MQERRRTIRVETPVLLGFANPTTQEPEQSFTQDVSEEGVRFPTAVPLGIGQQVPMTLELPFNTIALRATGEVVWIREISRLGGPQYDVGVRFCWIEDQDRQRLIRHLQAVFPRRV